MKFHSIRAALILIFSLPFAFVGGIWLQYILGFKFSTAVWVGYIALFGVAVEDGVVMVDFLVKYARRGGSQLNDIIKAGVLRVRPIVMTTATTVLALIPILLSSGAGSAELGRGEQNTGGGKLRPYKEGGLGPPQLPGIMTST